jgi:predicted ATP-dependent endonuclease of OLD family
MYISKININNFRNFKNNEILFNNGVNVIIGHNNAGKTNLLKALSLVLDSEGKKRLDLHDFNKLIPLTELKNAPPKISIAITITLTDKSDKEDLAMVGTWLVGSGKSNPAQLTYEFYLHDSEHANYQTAMTSITTVGPDALAAAWSFIQHDFLRHYKYRMLIGDPADQRQVDWEDYRKFDFQSLDAIRDVERDMHTGRNALLREVLDFFLDYEIKSLPLATHSKPEKEKQIREKRQEFSTQAQALMTLLGTRMKAGKGQILSYAKSTGASFDGATPDFEGNLSDAEVFSAIRLVVEHNTGIKVPASHNGLGYNNLIFMSLLLAKMQMNSDENYMGGNSKVYASLAIEEPEAHLHPAMQYKFLKFLNENHEQKKVRQVFITTHSAHITSALSLDEIICLNSKGGQTHVGYPGRVFPADGTSKKYVQRFLDATKSEMLFAKGVILVEGLAEQILMSTFARYHGKPLEDSQISVVNVSGRYFEHFVHLFASSSPFAINKFVACVTDVDPEKLTGTEYAKCYPFDIFPGDTTKTNPAASIATTGNIAYFTQDIKLGKTFEYELVLNNPTSKLLLSDSIKNKPELTTLMDLHALDKPIEDLLSKLRKSVENDKIADAIRAQTGWTNANKRIALIAARYLNSVGKGENALELAIALQGNFEEKDPIKKEAFVLPKYLGDAIDWACQ